MSFLFRAANSIKLSFNKLRDLKSSNTLHIEAVGASFMKAASLYCHAESSPPQRVLSPNNVATENI